MAHEYGHWIRTQVAPEEETPSKLGYAHARGLAKDGEGESGYVAEIAIFGGFVQCNRTFSGSYSNFRIIDKGNVAHRLPIATIKLYWERERFEPLILNNPIIIPPEYKPYTGSSGTAKVTTAETVHQQPTPACPCVVFLVLAEMEASAIADQMPALEVEAFETAHVSYELDEKRLKEHIVSNVYLIILTAPSRKTLSRE